MKFETKTKQFFSVKNIVISVIIICGISFIFGPFQALVKETKAEGTGSCTVSDTQFSIYYLKTSGSKITAAETIKVDLHFNNKAEGRWITYGTNSEITLRGELKAKPIITLSGPNYAKREITSQVLPNIPSDGYAFVPDKDTKIATFDFKFTNFNPSGTGVYNLNIAWKLLSFKPDTSQLPTGYCSNRELGNTTLLPPPQGTAYLLLPGTKKLDQTLPEKVARIELVNAPIPGQGGPGGTIEGYNDNVSVSKDKISCIGAANTVLCIVEQVVTVLVGILMESVFFIFTELISPLMISVLSIQPSDSQFVNVIFDIWVVFRNLMNILFIIILIIIALATLFRIEQYNYKHLLANVILMALLINFSLVISQTILGVADAVQSQFLPAETETVNSLAATLITGPYNNLAQGALLNGTQGQFSHIVSLFVYLAFGIGALVTFVAITAFLLIRIVMLWILLMTSPIAYGLNILPVTKQYASKWWTQFLNYAFFTPIMALFLQICALIVSKQSSYIAGVTGATFPTAPNQDFAQFTFNILTNVLVIGCLGVALNFAKSMGIAGASTVVGYAQKGINAPYKFYKYGAGAAVDLAQRKKQELAGAILDNKLIGRDEKGNLIPGLRGAIGRGLVTALSPAKSVNKFLETGKEKNKLADKLTDERIDTISKFRTSKGTKDIRADLETKKKMKDEETQRFMGDNWEQFQKGFDDSKAMPQNDKVKAVIENRFAASAKSGKIRSVVERKYGSYTTANIKKYVEEYTNGDKDLEKKVLGTMNDFGKKNHKVALIGINKETEEDQRKEQALAVNNMEVEEFKKADFHGVPSRNEDGSWTEVRNEAFKKMEDVDKPDSIPKRTKDFINGVAPRRGSSSRTSTTGGNTSAGGGETSRTSNRTSSTGAGASSEPEIIPPDRTSTGRTQTRRPPTTIDSNDIRIIEEDKRLDEGGTKT